MHRGPSVPHGHVDLRVLYDLEQAIARQSPVGLEPRDLEGEPLELPGVAGRQENRVPKPEKIR